MFTDCHTNLLIVYSLYISISVYPTHSCIFRNCTPAFLSFALFKLHILQLYQSYFLIQESHYIITHLKSCQRQFKIQTQKSNKLVTSRTHQFGFYIRCEASSTLLYHCLLFLLGSTLLYSVLLHSSSLYLTVALLHST